jgi:SAM-dependent methyltransferase
MRDAGRAILSSMATRRRSSMPGILKQSSDACPRTRSATPRGADASGSWRGVFAEALGPRPHRVLDVGTGLGDAAFLLWELGHYPQGVDASQDLVRRARTRARFKCAAIPFCVGDAEDLEFPAAVFDAVVARDVLGALPHPAWALAEWFRVLKSGGVVIVGETAAPVRGRTSAADYLRFSGFVDVQSRESPAFASGAPGDAPWYRKWTHPAARTGVAAWGTRP